MGTDGYISQIIIVLFEEIFSVLFRHKMKGSEFLDVIAIFKKIYHAISEGMQR